MLNLNLLELKTIEESRALLVLRNEIHEAIEFADDEAADDKTEAYTLGVDFLFLVLDRSKKLEKVLLVCLFHPMAIVCY